jgi:hypothetical protein
MVVQAGSIVKLGGETIPKRRVWRKRPTNELDQDLKLPKLPLALAGNRIDCETRGDGLAALLMDDRRRSARSAQLRGCQRSMGPRLRPADAIRLITGSPHAHAFFGGDKSPGCTLS